MQYRFNIEETPPTEHENISCNKCHLRFDNINDLQNHIYDNHGDGVKNTIENETNKKVKQDTSHNSYKCYNSRC